MDSATGDALLLGEVEQFHIGSRTISTGMLAWFLTTVWRIEPEEVDDAICDGGGDKGIDALVVDDDLLEITIMQGKWRQDPSKATQGDGDLKKLIGAADYFQSPETVRGLLASKPNVELERLLVRQHVEEKISEGRYSVKLIFVTNADLDSSADDYIEVRAGLSPPLTVWDRSQLVDAAERTRRPELREEIVTLDAVAPPSEVPLTESERLAIGLVPAKELVKLPGISDHTIFSRNVRLFAGRTRINNELRGTVQNLDEHRLFPAYHNGLTLLTESLAIDGSTMTLTRVGVVNGCQSLITLNDNRDALTDDLLLVVKVVEVPDGSDVADKITHRSNNQNAVTLRDQRSSDSVMRDLQQSVQEEFGNDFGFGIRLGERLSARPVLENSLAAQLIMSAYLREPWAAVRKVRLFDQDYRRIFSRAITPHKLYLLHLINQAVMSAREDLRDELRASFASIRYTLVYLIAEILRESEPGTQLLDQPQRWLRGAERDVKDALEAIVHELIDVVNSHVEEEVAKSDTYDAKVAFKSRPGVVPLQTDVVRDARRQARKDARRNTSENSYLFSVSPAPQKR